METIKHTYGVGINDYEGTVSVGGKLIRAYSVWRSMLSRCYREKDSNYKTYGKIGVYVCKDWLMFSNFKKWYDENYIEGYFLDKDIRGVVDENGNRYYSPETCMFVSSKANGGERGLRQTDDSKIYETKPTTSGFFLKHCRVHGKNIGDFIKIYSGKNRKSARLYYYYYKNNLSEERLEELLALEELEIWYKKYETFGVSRYQFLNACLTNGASIHEFIESFDGYKNGKIKYTYIKNKNITKDEIEELIKKDSQLWYEKYETIKISRWSFSKMCHEYGISKYEFVEVFSGEVNSGRKKLNYYFYKNSQQQEKLNELLKLEVSQVWYKHYETTMISKCNFVKACNNHSVSVSDFIEIDSNERIGNVKGYFYFCKKDLSDKELENLLDIQNNSKWYKKYENKTTRRADFKRSCVSHSIDFEDFKEVVSGEKNSKGENLYFYFKLS